MAEISYFFMTGAHKSGTTWVAQMMRGHPEVVSHGEAWFVGHAYSVDTWLDDAAFEKWARQPTVSSRWLRDADPGRLRLDMQRMMIEGVLRRHWRPGVRAIGDKTPFFYLRDVERLHELFPDAVLISVVRDGRDVAVSHQFQMLRNSEWRFFEDEEQGKKSRRFHIEGEGEPQPLFTEHTLRGFAENWKICVEGARRARALYGERFVEYRYDELKADPFVIARSLGAIGVDASAEAVERCVLNGDFKKMTGRAPGEASPGEFFRKGTSGDWVEHFTDRDKAIYKEVAGQSLIDEGYADSLDW